MRALAASSLKELEDGVPTEEPGLAIHPRCDEYLDALDWDPQGVFELLEACTESEIHKIEPDDKDRPGKDTPDEAVVFRIKPAGEVELYVKVVLEYPDLRVGRVLSFKPRGA